NLEPPRPILVIELERRGGQRRSHPQNRRGSGNARACQTGREKRQGSKKIAAPHDDIPVGWRQRWSQGSLYPECGGGSQTPPADHQDSYEIAKVSNRAGAVRTAERNKFIKPRNPAREPAPAQ